MKNDKWFLKMGAEHLDQSWHGTPTCRQCHKRSDWYVGWFNNIHAGPLCARHAEDVLNDRLMAKIANI